jgi:hypothetical protein
MKGERRKLKGKRLKAKRQVKQGGRLINGRRDASRLYGTFFDR